MMGKMKFVTFILFALTVMFSLTGCLSHWFLESESRLQVENGTENYTILSVDIMEKDSTASKSWVKETLLPGERSHVVEGDWIGNFTAQIRYSKFTDESGAVLKDFHKFDLDGGSLYLLIRESGDSLTYKFK